MGRELPTNQRISNKKMKRLQRYEMSFINSQIYWDYYERLENMAMEMFEWKNLPEGMESRHIERLLFQDGYALFTYSTQYGHIVQPCAYSGFNVYGDPTNFQVINHNVALNLQRTESNAVLIRNTHNMRPTRATIMLFAQRLFKIERSADMNVDQQRTPWILKTSKNNRLSVENMFRQYENYEYKIVTDEKLDVNDAIEVFQTGVELKANDLDIYRQSRWNEAMTFLGIDNAKNDKKERLITSEVQANNDQIDISREVMLQSRKYAVEQINKMFGTNISVDYKVKEEVTQNVEIHNPSENNNRE